MKARLGLSILLILSVLGLGWYWIHQNTLVPVPLADASALFVKANPEYGEDSARLEAVMPAGPGLEAFLAAQSDLSLVEKSSDGAWAGQLVSELEVSRHGKRWRITLKPDWKLQDGSVLDATRVAAVLGPGIQKLGGELTVYEPLTLLIQFKTRQEDAPGRLSQWRVPGSGPFIRKANALVRFDGFKYGKAGIAAVTVATDPAFLESHAWAGGLAARRWAWAVFPEKVAPEDMAKVRMASYDEFRMKDGSVWFLSRRLRRLRPNTGDWTRTRIFGAWKGAMDLPYDPLGM
jgi:hypothetical protein